MNTGYDFNAAEAKAHELCQVLEEVIRNLNSLKEDRRGLREQSEIIRPVQEAKDQLESRLDTKKREIESSPAKKFAKEKKAATSATQARMNADLETMEQGKDNIKKGRDEKDKELKKLQEPYKQGVRKLTKTERRQAEKLQKALYVSPVYTFQALVTQVTC